MSNMSYCRFENTLRDLRDCDEALAEMGDFEGLPDSEKNAAKRLIKICRAIADDNEHLLED